MKSLRQATSLALALLLSSVPALAGITVSGADGITVSGADGITISGADGIVASGADGILTFGVNGITVSGADGIVASGADGITASGADGTPAASANKVASTHPDGITVSGADGITVSGADGITISTADGTTRKVDSVTVRRPNGITISTADAMNAVGTDGVMPRQSNGITISTADGITISTADGITISTADGALTRETDGKVNQITPDGLSILHADGITASGADGITISTADGITISTADGVIASSGGAQRVAGLQSVDPELAVKLDQMTDDSSVNAVLVYHHLPTDQDLADLQRIGVIGGTRFRVLPMIYVTATRDQIVAVSHLPAVRSIYGNRTLEFTADPANGATGVDRARADSDITRAVGGFPVDGRGVTVAVLDTGIDATHADLAGRVAQNVKLADLQSVPAGFNYPVNVEGLPDTDTAYGHGTFVAGVIGGNGSRSNGQFTGVAPGARLVGLSAGDASLVFVLNGLDYLLDKGPSLGVRVVNCSFSAETVYDTNDPVNIATKMLYDGGVSVVFSAGNDGPDYHTLNPYASAPWVISVGATEGGKLASYSSRGDFARTDIHPTLVAPGTKIVSLRSSGVSQTGVEGPGFNSDTSLPPTLIPYYTTATGTSFSAPQVAGTIALMLEANPRLTPTQIKDILERTATPLAPYYQPEVGAGMLNAHAAVLEAAFPQRRMGRFRATMDGRFFRVVSDPMQVINGTVAPGSTGYKATFNVPANSLFASMRIGWGPLWTTNDLGLALYDAAGAKQADINTLNLPGLGGHQERALVANPTAGNWSMVVKNTLGVASTSQDFAGVLETAHAQYATLDDLSTLTPAQRADVYQSLRTYTLQPSGNKYRPTFSASRGDLAASLVMGGRVPQYLPAAPTYRDVRDLSTMLFVESAQRARGGPLFTDVSAGGPFNPDAPADRVTAAIALVRAAGLQSEVDSGGTVLTGVVDLLSIPTASRGYVRVAVAHGLLTLDQQSNFRPTAALTRLELAHAMAVLQSTLNQ
ncbi:MAG: S8 family serine peptidase [Acidobacteriota bacterium]|nr:S8 family serine peptidase [Acidobacteriota bacterium]